MVPGWLFEFGVSSGFSATEIVMENQVFQPIVVTGINMGEEECEIMRARAFAQFLFEPSLVSKLSPVGHNFVQSFCVFPTGSRSDRQAQKSHEKAVTEFCRWLSTTSLDYVALKWDGWSSGPEITHSHKDEASRSEALQKLELTEV